MQQDFLNTGIFRIFLRNMNLIKDELMHFKRGKLTKNIQVSMLKRLRSRILIRIRPGQKFRDPIGSGSTTP
jgi:hypothetical protein